ncbi:MAG: cyanophycinase [Pseudomonadota bacterium]
MSRASNNAPAAPAPSTPAAGSVLSPSEAAPRGSLALIGGRFEADNDALYRALRERCNARIAVLSMASGYPEEVGEEIVHEFRAQGFYAELIPIFFETRDSSPFDEALIERLRAFGSVFFTGGDQSRIVGTLIQDDGETPALTAIRSLYSEGGLIAGSSAGAAIMSGPMLLGGTSLHALSRGVDTSDNDDDFDAFRLGRGLGFFPWGMVDQHFLARGRIGRLICAARECGESLAFGIDENSALITHGDRAEVVGETGVVVADLRPARFVGDGSADDDYAARGISVSYLDDGDAFDLRRLKALPAQDKKRVRVGRHSYRTPAPVRRNAFASYGFHDLMLRLVEGDPTVYAQDSAQAFDPLMAHQITLRLRRRPRRSRALRAVRRGEIRYTALKFELDMLRAKLNACPLPASTRVLKHDPSPAARLVLLGNSPTEWWSEHARDLQRQLVEPVGVMATASGEPARMAEHYLDWLDSMGLRGELLPIGLHNIERASRDRTLLRSIDHMGSLLLTGGDQRRLTDTLLHCAEATPVLHHVVSAYERGTPVVAVAAAAAALGSRMIAEGDSVAALRYGSSEDASGSGAIIEPGIGLSRLGLIDQHFVRRHRLGRLLIACCAQGQRFGFGLCEGSGMIIHGGDREIEAIGRTGVVIAHLDLGRVRMAPGAPDPSGISLSILEPGRRVAIDDIADAASDRSSIGTGLLESALQDMERDYERALGDSAPFDAGRWQQTIQSVPIH